MKAPVHHYALLGVHALSTPQEIREARRKLAQAYHPDRHPEHADLMARINAATATLLGPGAAKYRASIGTGRCVACKGSPGWAWVRNKSSAKAMKMPCTVCKGAGRV